MKVLTLEQLPYFIQKIVALIPGVATVSKPGLVPALPQESGEERVLLGTGEWGEYHGGGGGAGMMDLYINKSGHLMMKYDDGVGAPDVEIKRDGPLTGHLVWSYEAEE